MKKKVFIQTIFYAIICFMACMFFSVIDEHFEPIQIGIACAGSGAIGVLFGADLKK